MKDWTAVGKEERVMVCPNAEVGWQFVTSIRFPPVSFDPIHGRIEVHIVMD